MLIVDKVTKRFGGLVAVNNVSLQIKEGERVGLIGPNGSGKTTLFNCITGFLKVNSGRIIFKDKDITNRPSNEINHLGINRTFQIPRSFPTLTVYENVMVAKHFGKKAESRSFDVEDVIEIVGLKDKMDIEARYLNVHERKMVDLARALVTYPEVLLIDEIVAGLSDEEIGEVAKLLKRLNEEYGITLFVVEHVMKFIRRIVDRVYVLDYGKKIFEGSVEEAMSDEKVIKAYLGEKMEV